MIEGSAVVAQVTNLTHCYGNTKALNDISLQVPSGCMAGFIGPDGVGKSSLLALFSGARKIQTGAVQVFGGDMGRNHYRTSVLPRIAYMPQGLGKNLYATLSVFENVDFFGRLFGQGRRERERRIKMLLESTGLIPFADRPAAKLSGGMKQKLGLCCALIHDPDLLILDEPTTGVDPLSRRQFWELIDRIRTRREGMSVLVATAYMEEAERFDWLAAMDAGQVLTTGTAAQIRAHTGADTLDDAFIALLPEERRRGHRVLTIPDREAHGGKPAIEAQGLTKRFGNFTAVDHVSLRIERGEIFGFLGSNGCGKTTTMKMLTGLLPANEGQAWLFGHKTKAHDLEIRKRVGYMSQAFSLYSELTVRQNLELHAKLFHLPKVRVPARLSELIQRFGLGDYVDDLAADLPLGIRQRLSLAVAVVHEPEMLILDEPTSGVDPLARDGFWELLIELSRKQAVTIFISTHFMNEAERCDRISLMHAGKVLASDTPVALIQARGAKTLEEAFIAHLEEAVGAPKDLDQKNTIIAPKGPPMPKAHHRAGTFSLLRLLGYARREALEIYRDPIRLTFALLGTVLLMFIFGYGITLDVTDLPFAVLDRDQTPESRNYTENISGSGYFIEHRPINDYDALDGRMRNGELSLAFEIPPDFGKDLKRRQSPAIGAWIDGAMPFRAETIRGYVQVMHLEYLSDLSIRTLGIEPHILPADIEIRYRYNQDFKSIYAMVPAVIPLLLIFIPSMLMALGVVREKELGSITNLYVTPVTRLEFLLGKQMPYIGISMINFLGLVAMGIFIFKVPLKGSFTALSIGALLYVMATTGLGLLVSVFTGTQIAAICGTAIITMVPAINFSGLMTPVSSLEGAAALIGKIYPTAHFLKISVGTFTKALGFGDLYHYFIPLAISIPVLLLLSLALLKKQEV